MLDDVLIAYFGAVDINRIDAEAFDEGLVAMTADFNASGDDTTRFTLWQILCVLGRPPSPPTMFASTQLQEAAHGLAIAVARGFEAHRRRRPSTRHHT